MSTPEKSHDRENDVVAERHEDGVFNEDGIWCAYIDGVLIACGPDKPIIQATYEAGGRARQDRPDVTDPLAQLRAAIGYHEIRATLRCGGKEPYHSYPYHPWLPVVIYMKCRRCGHRRWH